MNFSALACLVLQMHLTHRLHGSGAGRLFWEECYIYNRINVEFYYIAYTQVISEPYISRNPVASSVP